MQRELPPMSRSWILAGAQKDISSRRAAPRKGRASCSSTVAGWPGYPTAYPPTSSRTCPTLSASSPATGSAPGLADLLGVAWRVGDVAEHESQRYGRKFGRGH